MENLALPLPKSATPRLPRTPASSYRFEVWTFEQRVDCATGSVENIFKKRLWAEPEGRELTWEVPSRVTSAMFWMRQHAYGARAHVMLGWRSLYGDVFEACTYLARADMGDVR